MGVRIRRQPRRPEMVSLPGLAHECRLRGWTVQDLSVQTGLHWLTCQKAIAGEPVSPATREAIVRALEANPASELRRRLLTGEGNPEVQE